MPCKDCTCDSIERLEFDIDAQDSFKIQRHLFLYNGLANILVQFTSDTKYKPDTIRYNEIKDEYLTEFIKYNMYIDTIKSIVAKDNNLILSEYSKTEFNLSDNKIYFYR